MQTLTPARELLERAVAGERLSLDDGMRLYAEAGDDELREAADAIRKRRHPEGIVTYLVDRNINYTNVCIIDCGFCAFYRKPASPEGYLLTNDQIGQKVQELQDWGGTRILLQGGVHPYFKLDYYTGLLRYIKENYPGIECDSFSPVEVWNIARIMKMPLEDVLHELRLAGMDGLPGGGAEILDNRTINGTFVNGARVESAVLHKGDTVTIGNVDLVFDGATLVRRTETEAATDTGGLEYGDSPMSAYAGEIRAQAKRALEGADLILFVVDGAAGLLPEDRDIAGDLRGAADRVIVLVNKIDRKDADVNDFYELGLDRVMPVSAEHGEGIDDVLDLLPAEHVEEDDESAPVRLAIIGRPRHNESDVAGVVHNGASARFWRTFGPALGCATARRKVSSALARSLVST